jgi:peptidoglycan/xylan/chitin deacetylase (PgdA/CDA1 family)
VNAEERRARNIARYEARVRQVKRIKRIMAVSALAVVLIIVLAVNGVARRRSAENTSETARISQDNGGADESVAAQSASATPAETNSVTSGSGESVSSNSSEAVSSGSAGESVTTSVSSSSREKKIPFGSVGSSLSEAILEQTGTARSSSYIWASPRGAKSGTTIDQVINDDPASLEGTEKIIYLTFDDGPGPYTENLLQILEKHNAKATFFVTNQFPEYQDMIKKEAEAGHSIGVHTYLHDYGTIYSSTDAFWNDFEQMQDVIEEQTGRRTELMRFPGGSSNTISAKYCTGIMTQLAQQAEQKGYTFFDWNASSGDGNADTTTESVLEKSEKEVSYNDTSVLLCHDMKETTVEAIDQLLYWGEENGYTFLPLSPNSMSCHQKINN